MKKITLILFTFFFISNYAQIEEKVKSKKELRIEKRAQKIKDKEKRIKSYVNPKGKWFFGAEIGSNRIRNYTIKEDEVSFQGGFLAEYYFKKNWSLSSKLKYLKTGVSFYQPEFICGGMGFFSCTSREEYSGTFRANTIVIPLFIKWEFRILKNFKGHLKYGISFNHDTESQYTNYTSNVSTDYPKTFFSQASGLGFNYFINNNASIHIDIEGYLGQNRAKEYRATTKNINHIVNIGYKFNFH